LCCSKDSQPFLNQINFGNSRFSQWLVIFMSIQCCNILLANDVIFFLVHEHTDGDILFDPHLRGRSCTPFSDSSGCGTGHIELPYDLLFHFGMFNTSNDLDSSLCL
jgi:hypothetical protein